MIKPQDFFGASPKTVLNKPFFHAQDQKEGSVSGGNSTADTWIARVLNTVIYNDIQGASLVSNQVELPAGTYYVEGSQPLWHATLNAIGITGIFIDGVLVLQGSCCLIKGPNQTLLPVSGIITLSASGVVELRYYVGHGETNGLGASNIAGSIADTTLPGIYADLKIWQLDRSLEIAPVAINSGLQTVPSLDTTGNIMGFDISKTGANELTITKGSCLDSTLTTSLVFTSDKTLAIPSVANTIYHIFCVKTTGGLYEARAYTSEAAVLSDGTVDKFRWIGFWRTNGSSQCMEGLQVDGTMSFLKPSETVVASGFTNTSWTLLTLTGLIPVSRVVEIYPGSVTGPIDGTLAFSLDGVITTTYTVSGNMTDSSLSVWGTSQYAIVLRQIPMKNGVLYAKVGSGAHTVGVAQVKLRR